MASNNGIATELPNRIEKDLDKPNDLLASLLSRLGSKGRIKGTLIVNGVESSKATLRAGLSTYTDDEFDKAATANGIDVTRTVDVTFHGVFRAKSHTDRVIGENAMEFIAELQESNTPKE